MKLPALFLSLAVPAAAFAVDLDYLFAPGRPYDGGETTGSRELKWDNGSRSYFVWWFTGAGSRVGNDFKGKIDAGTIVNVKKVRILTTSLWPNDRWDGFRVALYDLDNNGVPGSIIWPTSGTGYFFKPSGVHGHVWVEVPIDWVSSTHEFAAAMEQVYSAPNCDPFAVDTNPTFRNHSWRQYSEGEWEKFHSPADPYRNLMIRAVISEGPPVVGVEPATLGRVKALFY